MTALQPPSVVTPRTLARALQPRWAIDAPGPGGLRLFDVAASPHGIRLEWIDAQSRIAAELEVVAESPKTRGSPATARGLDVRRLPGLGGDRGLADGLAQDVASAMERHPGGHTRLLLGETLDPRERAVPSLSDQWTPLIDFNSRPECPGLPVELRTARARLGSWPRIWRHSTGDSVSVEYPSGGGARLAQGAHWLRLSAEKLQRRRFRDALETLGYSADPRGVVRTVPWPTESFVAPVRPRIVVSSTPRVTAARWTASIEHDARLLIPVCSWGHHLARWHGGLTAMRLPLADLVMVPHDMAVHVWAWHRLPDEFFAAIGRQARQRPKSIRLGVAQARFFENTLTRACLRVWSHVVDPADFQRRIDGQLDGLLAEHRRGGTANKGRSSDGPSG